jgi:hypothetical protein
LKFPIVTPGLLPIKSDSVVYAAFLFSVDTVYLLVPKITLPEVSIHAIFRFFLYFGHFYIILRNDPDQKFFFSNLVLLSRVSMIDATHKGVAPYVLARVEGLARA